jgi:hypothetical protein
VLGNLEAKKFSMFLGCSVKKYETTMVDGDPHAEMLENSNAPEDVIKLRHCHWLAGEAELQTDAAGAGSSRGACTWYCSVQLMKARQGWSEMEVERFLNLMSSFECDVALTDFSVLVFCV